MSVCASCGFGLAGADGLCLHHAMTWRDGWADGNRAVCDFIHRGIVRPVPRDDGADWWAAVAATVGASA